MIVASSSFIEAQVPDFVYGRQKGWSKPYKGNLGLMHITRFGSLATGCSVLTAMMLLRRVEGGSDIEDHDHVDVGVDVDVDGHVDVDVVTAGWRRSSPPRGSPHRLFQHLLGRPLPCCCCCCTVHNPCTRAAGPAGC